MEKCGLYLGCNIPFKAPDIEQSLRQVFPPLGVDIVDLPGASCCPAWGTAPSFDIDTWLALSARNIALAEKQDVDVMTGCNSCFGVLSEAKHVIDGSAAKKEVVNEKLAAIDSAYAGSSKIYHVGHVLHEKIGTEKIKAVIYCGPPRVWRSKRRILFSPPCSVTCVAHWGQVHPPTAI